MAGREHMVRNEINVLKRVSIGHKNILTVRCAISILPSHRQHLHSCMTTSRRADAACCARRARLRALQTVNNLYLVLDLVR
jgi:hypothetical protein